MIPDSTLPAVLLAGVVAGVLLAGAGLLAKIGRAQLASALAALAVGAGYLAGALVLEGRPQLPPTNVQQWLLVLAPAAVLVGALDGSKLPAWARWPGHALAVAGGGFLVCRPLFQSWSANEALVSSAGFLLVSIGAAGTLAAAAERLTPRWAAVVTFAFAAGSSFLMVIAGSVGLGLLGGSLAATAGAAVVVALAGLGLEKGRALPGTVATLSSLLWARSFFYADLKPAGQATYVAAVVLFALVPLTALLGERFAREKKGAGPIVLRLACVALPVVLGLGLAAATSPRFAPTEAGEGY